MGKLLWYVPPRPPHSFPRAPFHPLPAAMNARFSLLAAAALSILSLAPAQAAMKTIWHETFDSIGNASTKWDSSGTSLSSADVVGWTVVSGTVYTGQKGVRVGAAKTAAVFKSPSIAPDNAVNDIIVVVNAAAYYNVAGTQYIKVEVHDASDNVLATFGGNAGEGNLNGTLTQHTSADAVEIPTTSDYMKSFAIPASVFPSSGNMYLVFSCDSTNPTSQNRLLIGDVLVTQATVSSLTQLGTPDNLLAPSTNYFGFALSWDPVTHATNGYTVTLSPADGNSGVTVSGTTATMTGLAEGETYDVSVVAKGDGTGTEDSEAAILRGVTTLTDPVVAPVPTTTDVSSSAFTVSWPAQNDASFSVRAWTLVPVNEVTEFFTDWYNQNLTLPQGWTKEGDLGRYAVVASPIAFNDNNQSLTSPTFAGTVSSLSFVVRRYNGNTDKPSTFRVYGSSGESGVEWTLLKELDLFTQIGTSGTSVSINSDSVPDLANYHCFRFVYEKDGGNCGFGSFSVTGTGVGKQPSYLTGYGPDATAVAGTSVTISNPVAGETNYIEVTATGLSGKTASATIAVPVPAVATPKPAVISVK